MGLIPYKNEEYIDWSDENVEAMRVALEKVGGELNRSYPAVIGGTRVETEDEIVSVNPANPSQVVGRVARGTEREADMALDVATDTFEHFRRRKPHCSGTLFWQLNDCWPVLSWSVLDYHGFGKAGYYYARRAYSPILASFKALSDGSTELWLTNDTLKEVQDNVTVRLRTFEGEKIWEEISRHTPTQTPVSPSSVGMPTNASAHAFSYISRTRSS